MATKDNKSVPVPKAVTDYIKTNLPNLDTSNLPGAIPAPGSSYVNPTRRKNINTKTNKAATKFAPYAREEEPITVMGWRKPTAPKPLYSFGEENLSKFAPQKDEGALLTAPKKEDEFTNSASDQIRRYATEQINKQGKPKTSTLFWVNNELNRQLNEFVETSVKPVALRWVTELWVAAKSVESAYSKKPAKSARQANEELINAAANLAYTPINVPVEAALKNYPKVATALGTGVEQVARAIGWATDIAVAGVSGVGKLEVPKEVFRSKEEQTVEGLTLMNLLPFIGGIGKAKTAAMRSAEKYWKTTAIINNKLREALQTSSAADSRAYFLDAFINKADESNSLNFSHPIPDNVPVAVAKTIEKKIGELEKNWVTDFDAQWDVISRTKVGNKTVGKIYAENADTFVNDKAVTISDSLNVTSAQKGRKVDKRTVSTLESAYQEIQTALDNANKRTPEEALDNAAKNPNELINLTEAQSHILKFVSEWTDLSKKAANQLVDQLQRTTWIEFRKSSKSKPLEESFQMGDDLAKKGGVDDAKITEGATTIERIVDAYDTMSDYARGVVDDVGSVFDQAFRKRTATELLDDVRQIPEGKSPEKAFNRLKSEINKVLEPLGKALDETKPFAAQLDMVVKELRKLSNTELGFGKATNAAFRYLKTALERNPDKLYKRDLVSSEGQLEKLSSTQRIQLKKDTQSQFNTEVDNFVKEYDWGGSKESKSGLQKLGRKLVTKVNDGKSYDSALQTFFEKANKLEVSAVKKQIVSNFQSFLGRKGAKDASTIQLMSDMKKEYESFKTTGNLTTLKDFNKRLVEANQYGVDAATFRTKLREYSYDQSATRAINDNGGKAIITSDVVGLNFKGLSLHGKVGQILNDWGSFFRENFDTVRKIEKMGGGYGSEWVKKMAQAPFTSYMGYRNYVTKNLNTVLSHVQKLSDTKRVELMVAIYGMRKEGLQRLTSKMSETVYVDSKGNWTDTPPGVIEWGRFIPNGNYKIPTDKQVNALISKVLKDSDSLAAIIAFRNWNEGVLPSIKSYFEQIKGTPLKDDKNYAQLIYSRIDDSEILDDPFEQIFDSMDKSFTKEVESSISRSFRLETDPFKYFGKVIDSQTFFSFMWKPVMEADGMVNSLSAIGGIGEGAKRFAKKYIDNIKTNGRGKDQSELLRAGSSFLTMQGLGGKIAPALSQVGSAIDSSYFTSVGWFARVANDWARNKKYISQVSEAVSERMSPEITQDYQFGKWAFNKGLGELTSTSLYMLRFTDSGTSKYVWMNFYREFMINNGKMKKSDWVNFQKVIDESAVQYADYHMTRAMSANNPIFRPLGYNSEILNMLTIMNKSNINRFFEAAYRTTLSNPTPILGYVIANWVQSALNVMKIAFKVQKGMEVTGKEAQLTESTKDLTEWLSGKSDFEKANLEELAWTYAAYNIQSFVPVWGGAVNELAIKMMENMGNKEAADRMKLPSFSSSPIPLFNQIETVQRLGGKAKKYEGDKAWEFYATLMADFLLPGDAGDYMKAHEYSLQLESENKLPLEKGVTTIEKLKENEVKSSAVKYDKKTNLKPLLDNYNKSYAKLTNFVVTGKLSPEEALLKLVNSPTINKFMEANFDWDKKEINKRMTSDYKKLLMALIKWGDVVYEKYEPEIVKDLLLEEAKLDKNKAFSRLEELYKKKVISQKEAKEIIKIMK